MTTTLPQRADPELELLRRYADHPSAFLAYNTGVQYFTTPEVPGVVAYRRRGRNAFCLGGPFAAAQDRQRLLEAFLTWARRARLRVTAVQVRAEDATLYAAHGFTVDSLGLSYSVDLERFTLAGKPLAKVRQNIRRAQREAVVVTELGPGHPETGPKAGPEAGPEAELDAVDAAWLRAKGKLVNRLEFLVGERGGRGAPYRRTFVARQSGRVVAYITYSPAYGARPGWLYDLTRRRPDAPVGTIELIHHAAQTTLHAQGAAWMHLGLTPFLTRSGMETPAGRETPSGRDRSDVPQMPSSRSIRALVTGIERHGTAFYSARNAHAFKVKWAPQVIEPEFVAFTRPVSVAAVWHLLRLVNAF